MEEMRRVVQSDRIQRESMDDFVTGYPSFRLSQAISFSNPEKLKVRPKPLTVLTRTDVSQHKE